MFLYYLQQESSRRDTPGDLPEKLDIDDEEFLYSFPMCLSLCKQCLELVEKSVLSDVFVLFDSLFLHKNDAAISQEISKLMRKESSLDTSQEAGSLFAFVWGNEQKETSISSSWWQQVEISGISPTHFLAINCRMIIHQTTISHPDLEKGFASEYVTEQFISLFYLDTIGRVQNYQQRVLDNVIRHSMDSAKHHSSVQETSSQAIPLQTDVRMTQFLSLGSNKSKNSSSRSTSSLHGCQRYPNSLSNNPTMTRSPASGSSRGSSMNSFRTFQAASAAITIRLKDYQGSHTQNLDEQGSST
ncbi:hypothetical protein FOXYSP1_17922 [Fusarium oxysporum f. sp. phaseoli]